MSRKKATLLGLPDEINARIVPYLDRGSLDVLCQTNKSLRLFLESNDAFFDQWPRLDDLFYEQEHREVVHLVKSPNNKKLCAVVRQYQKAGKLLIFDIKKGLISTRAVNASFLPVFSPDSDLIVAGNNGVGILIGRIATPAHTRASVRDERKIINWYTCNERDIRGVTFINQEQVWISHRYLVDSVRITCILLQ